MASAWGRLGWNLIIRQSQSQMRNGVLGTCQWQELQKWTASKKKLKLAKLVNKKKTQAGSGWNSRATLSWAGRSKISELLPASQKGGDFIDQGSASWNNERTLSWAGRCERSYLLLLAHMRCSQPSKVTIRQVSTRDLIFLCHRRASHILTTTPPPWIEDRRYSSFHSRKAKSGETNVTTAQDIHRKHCIIQ